jgi:hypothetical protein
MRTGSRVGAALARSRAEGSGLRGPYERQKRRWQEEREQPVRLMRFVERPKPYDTDATGELNIATLG